MPRSARRSSSAFDPLIGTPPGRGRSIDAVLVNPPQSFRRGNVWRGIMGCTPPLGLAMLAAVLERGGFGIRILDANAERLDHGGLARRLEELRAAAGAPAWVGITASTNTFPAAARAAAAARTVFPGARLVMGGVHATVRPEEALRIPGVDSVVRGEGEHSLLALLGQEAPGDIPNLSHRAGDAVVHNPDREHPTDLAALPIAAYHLLPMTRYRPALGSYRRLPAVGVVISRGCPGSCSFCFGHHLGKVTRYRPVAAVVEEIAMLRRDWGIREISFYDDTFTAKKEYVGALCEAFLAAGLDLSWSCFSRVDCVDGELLRLMRAAGCHQICYGVESGSEEILRSLRKKVSLSRARAAIGMTRGAGIETRATFMLGSPGETPQTMEATLRAAIDLDPDIALFNITTPFPGTEMFSWALEHGCLSTQDWSCYDFSRPIMRLPTLSEEELLAFYAACHRRFYRRGRYLLRRLLRMRTVEDLRVNWRAFHAVLLGGD